MISRRVVRLSKSASRLQFIASLIFVVFGVISFAGSLFTPLPVYFKLFALIWTIIAGSITFKAFRSGFSNKGNDLYEIEDSTDKSKIAFDDRLRKLEKLRIERLIDDNEYDKKRKEIMEDKW